MTARFGMMLALVAALVVTAAPNLAFGQPGGGGRGGFGGPGGLRGVLGEEARRELELSDEQVEKLEGIAEKMREEMRGTFEGRLPASPKRKRVSSTSGGSSGCG